MKHYEEMARDVLRRAEQYEERRTRQRKTVGRVAAALSCLLLVAMVGSFFLRDGSPATVPQRPDDSSQIADFASGLSAVYYSNGAIQEEMLRENATILQHFSLETDDLTGLSPEEIEQLRKLKKDLKAEEIDAWMDQGYAVRAAVFSVDEKSLVSYLSSCSFSLQVEDWDAVQEIRSACDSVYGQVEFAIHSKALIGQKIAYGFTAEDGTVHRDEKTMQDSGFCWLHGQSVTLPGEVCRAIYSDTEEEKGNLTLTWKPSQALLEAVADDPAFDVPSHHISYTVVYENGVQEMHRLRVEVLDSQGYVTYLGGALVPEDVESLLTNGEVCG